MGIFVWDFDGRLLEANDEFLRMVGYDREDLLGGSIRWTDLTPHEWRDSSERRIERQRSSGRFEPFEKEYTRKDGSRVPVLIGGATFEVGGNDGVAFVLDLTERKRADDRLRRNEAYLAEAERLSHTGGWAMNRKGERTIVYWSEESYRIFGRDPQQGMPPRDWIWQQIHPDDRSRLREEADAALREKRDYVAAFRILLPDGTIKHLESNAHHLFSTDGELLEVMGTFVDLTERKRTEDALRESEYNLRRIVETVPSMLWSTGPDGEPTRINQRILDYSGLTLEKFLNLGWKEFLHPEDFPETARAFFHAIKTGEPYEAVHRLRRVDGQYRWHHARGEPLRDEEQRVIQWYGLSIDIDERKRAEDALRKSEAKFRDYAETASDWFWEIGPDYKFTLLTENAFGSHSADRIGTICWDHALDVETEPEKWRLVWATLDARESFRDFVYCTMDGNGAPMFVKASGKPVFDLSGKFLGYRGTGTDVTAIVRGQQAEASLRTVQAELAHVSRVMTLGQLTASIAHEVNQPIGSARNNARAALNFLDRSPTDLGEVREALGCIVADADRAGGIIDRIRDQIKKVPPRSDRFDLNRAIEEVIGLAQSMITENGVSVQSRLASGMVPVYGDRVQLQQVVLNLVLNAVEAMSSVELGQRELLISTDQGEANGTLVAVRDSGPGIDPEHLELVFEAFYSTKSGMGMGLSICRSIIAAHGGRLWAAATEPRGTLFQFTLPSGKSSIDRPFTMRESRKKTSL